MCARAVVVATVPQTLCHSKRSLGVHKSEAFAFWLSLFPEQLEHGACSQASQALVSMLLLTSLVAWSR